MHLSFIQDLLPTCKVNIRVDKTNEIATITKSPFKEPIVINYWPEEYYTYYLEFATQHRETSSKEVLITYIQAFALGEKAAIEFFDQEKRPRFGGEIEVTLLDALTCDALCNYFGYDWESIRDLTLQVRAWDERYCFDGFFHTNKMGVMDIVKVYTK